MSEISQNRGGGDVYVVKMNGERELFDTRKLRESLRRAKASESIANAIVKEVQSNLYDGMLTSEMYQYVYDALEKQEKPTAMRYSLRRALANFGPTGFPFEHFVGELFRAKGYKVRTGVTLPGRCIEHEVDMVAENDAELISMEIKFHNDIKTKSDLQVALYVKARFDDIVAGSAHTGKERKGWLLTNTKFTKNVIHYAECVGMNVVSWSYPENGSLQMMIEELGIHPLTCLSTLPSRETRLLMDKGIVLCRDVKENSELLTALGLPEETVHDVMSEAAHVCTVK
jgi:hypothetical protein